MENLLLAIIAFQFLPGCHPVEVKQDSKLLLVRAEEAAVLSCTQNENTYLNMYWYQQKLGQGLKLMIHSINEKEEEMEADYKVRWSVKRPSVFASSLHLDKAAKEDSATYFCASRQQFYTGSSTLYFGEGTILTVLETGKKRKYPKVKIYLPNKQEYKEHKLISLVCVATGFYPEHVRLEWFVNDITWKSIYENVPQESDDKETFYTSKRLSLTRLEYFNPDNTFKCVAGFIGDDPKNKTSDEVKGEADCSISKEEYGMYIYQGKISYIMVLCKSAMYGIIVVFIIWRRKAIGTSS